MLALALLLALADEPSTAPPPAAEGSAGAQQLPDSLPPLDDKLVNDPASPLKAFALARIRGELDDSRDLSRVDDVSVGTSLTGRVGVSAEIDGAKLDVVAGDGARVGMPPTAPLLVSRPALPALFQAELSFDLGVAGFPGALSIGRMPVVVGDGRWIGVEPFDPRGRTLDGARLRAHAGPVDANVSAFWLGPGDLDARDTGRAVSGLLLVEAAARPEDMIDFDVYGFVHRDGVAGVTASTLGLRLSGAWWFLRGRAGADVQAPVVDGQNAFAPAGYAGHVEAGVRAQAPLALFDVAADDAPSGYVDVGGELTAGTAVRGRVFRAPAPTQHGVLGLLDFVAADNTWSAAAGVGADDHGVKLDLSGRVIGVVDRGGPLLDVGGRAIPQYDGHGTALFELDASGSLPVTSDLALGVAYAVAIPGTALIGDEPAQRLLVTLSGAFGGAPLP